MSLSPSGLFLWAPVPCAIDTTITVSLPSLDDGHLLLCCLAVAVKKRDPVLVGQVARKADKTLPDSQIRRAFGRLKGYGMNEEDMAWLESLEA